MIRDEWSLIGEINSTLGKPVSQEIIMGMGDDCAVWQDNKSDKETFSLFSTDMAVETVHFDLTYCSPFHVGHKSMVSNISDILAMGGKPLHAMVSLGVPKNIEMPFITELYRGMKEVGDSFGTSIVGGDTTASERVIVNIAIYGRAENPIYRRGSVPGDRIYVTTWQGSSRLGLEVLRSEHCGEGDLGVEASSFPLSVTRHVMPTTPTMELTQRIVRDFSPHAMIDVSDGIISELQHLCSFDNLGFTLEEERLVIHSEVERFSSATGRSPLDYILNSGEEYGLLFTSPMDIEDDGVIQIGSITESGFMIDKREGVVPIENEGFNHFRRKK